ncbi:MAG TPA: UDP-N-acetylmuramate:L-alanyl-gamma-D-glutamyl-meso-diaminopimelate ligase, partial [bacterium]
IMQRFSPDAIKRVYFIAICGTGMTALAGMLKSRGYDVRGSDQNVYPPMSTFLDELSIPYHIGFDEKHLDPPPDLVVIGNAMSRGNPEVEAVLERKICYISLPFALKEFFIRGKYSCVVVGTHGKTTTSALLAWVLENAGRDPGFFMGGIPENFGRGFRLGDGNVFVTEGDEYDSAFFDKGSKFFHYLPDLVILNNIEFDHADIFRNLDEIETAFNRFINLIPRNGYLIAGWDDPIVRKLSAKAFSKVVTFGLGKDATWQARNIVGDALVTRFDVYQNDKRMAQVMVPLFGEHMVKNCLGVIAAGNALGLSMEEISAGLATFKNVRRRLQFKGERKNIKIFDDFAHHPTAVKATLAGLRSRYPRQRIWAMYEPRTASSKRRVFEHDYIAALAVADRVILTPLYMPEKVSADERLSVESIVSALNQAKIQAWIVPPNSEMLDFLKSQLESGDIALFMSNGDFHGIPEKLLNII